MSESAGGGGTTAVAWSYLTHGKGILSWLTALGHKRLVILYRFFALLCLLLCAVSAPL